MRLYLPLAGAVLAVALTGCKTNSYCLGDQDYQHAEERAPLQPVGDLSLPDSPTALRIPKRVDGGQPYGTTDEKGNGVCLDKPPAFNGVMPPPPANLPRQIPKKK